MLNLLPTKIVCGFEFNSTIRLIKYLFSANILPSDILQFSAKSVSVNSYNKLRQADWDKMNIF